MDTLKTILKAVSDQQIAQMQATIREVYKYLTWNDPPLPYDAFHSVMFELWHKHNIVTLTHQ